MQAWGVCFIVFQFILCYYYEDTCPCHMCVSSMVKYNLLTGIESSHTLHNFLAWCILLNVLRLAAVCRSASSTPTAKCGRRRKRLPNNVSWTEARPWTFWKIVGDQTLTMLNTGKWTPKLQSSALTFDLVSLWGHNRVSLARYTRPASTGQVSPIDIA